MRRVTPMGALVRGLVAGAVGSAVQSLFFKATARLAPKSPEGAFEPPEERQASEMATATVARRFVEGLMQRGPLSEKDLGRGSEIVHFAYGALWGGLWGLARESSPKVASTAGVALFSNLVWALGDELMYPAFRLGAWPQAYPLKTHAYANVAHVAYGLGVCAAYDALRRPWGALAASSVWAFGARRKLHRKLPDALHPVADRILDAAAAVRSRRSIASAAFAGA